MVANAQLSFVNVVARDLDALAGFYQQGFDLAEVVSERSEVYRAFHTGTTLLGFNAWAAYGLLGIEELAVDMGVRSYLTFDPGSDAAVDAAVERLVSLGATLVKGPVRTPYDAWMAVLLDPEGNVVRASHLGRTPSTEVAA
ncbi:glyoxalase/bleomycin resistance/dioxygenase family protein [soil metagenome]